jgi:hypothetical protein
VVNLNKAAGIALNNTEYIIRVRSWIVLQPNASHQYFDFKVQIIDQAPLGCP